MTPMKLNLSGLFAVLLLPVLSSGCTNHDALPDGDDRTPVQLCARGGVLEGAVTRTEPKEAFTASVAFSLVSGEYASPVDKYEGIWTAAVNASGAITWKTEGGVTAPVYPPYGEHLFLVAYAPEAIPASGRVTYDLTGQSDLLYASELQGDKWDGDRFSGNTQPAKDRPLVFNHLLTRLCFKACKKQGDGPTVRITGITVNGTDTRAILTLATGETVFDTSSGDRCLTFTPENGGTDITGIAATTVGSLMLPPASAPASYTLTVQTSMGTYENVSISYENISDSNLLQAGYSHDITLTIADHELAVTSVGVEPWMLVDAGDLDIGERE